VERVAGHCDDEKLSNRNASLPEEVSIWLKDQQKRAYKRRFRQRDWKPCKSHPCLNYLKILQKQGELSLGS